MKYTVINTKSGFAVQNTQTYVIAYESMVFNDAQRVCDNLNRGK